MPTNKPNVPERLILNNGYWIDLEGERINHGYGTEARDIGYIQKEAAQDFATAVTPQDGLREAAQRLVYEVTHLASADLHEDGKYHCQVPRQAVDDVRKALAATPAPSVQEAINLIATALREAKLEGARLALAELDLENLAVHVVEKLVCKTRFSIPPEDVGQAIEDEARNFIRALSPETVVEGV
jgi:hypothetical protein